MQPPAGPIIDINKLPRFGDGWDNQGSSTPMPPDTLGKIFYDQVWPVGTLEYGPPACLPAYLPARLPACLPARLPACLTHCLCFLIQEKFVFTKNRGAVRAAFEKKKGDQGVQLTRTLGRHA